MYYYDPVQTGIRIKALRQQRGDTQEAFAEHLHTTRSHIAKLEHGVRSPSLELLVEISALTGVTLDYLILGHTDCGHWKAEAQSLLSSLTQLIQAV